MNMKNISRNLLLEEPLLSSIENPFERFYKYRALADFPDRDRSNTAKDVYKKLGWYCENTDKKILEPDTFFASSHNLVRNLLRKHDSKYYENHYREYCIAQGIDYDYLDNHNAKYYRYLWMTDPNVTEHYNYIINEKSLLAYIEATHEIGNFLIVPKKFGSKKARKFKECPIQSLQYIQDNWNMYSESYHGITFEVWKELHILEDCFTNSNLKSSLIIDCTKPFADIFNTLEEITEQINKRNHKIILRLNTGK